MKQKFTFLMAAVMLLTMMVLPWQAMGQTKDPIVLFHETFGDNSGSARVWNDSYSVKSGVTAVYSGVSSYTMTNLKQSKNTMGSTKSGLTQTTKDVDAVFESGPYNVSKYENLAVTYQWKAASTNGTYSTSLYYKTSASGSYVSVSGTGNGATSFVTRSYSLPAECQVSTLYFKVVFNTSNTNALIDEFELTGVESVTDTYTVTCATGLTNGSIAANVSEAAAGDCVTITATPSTGYQLSSVTVNKGGGGSVSSEITGNTATFTMPADNVTVSATFARYYTITCASSSNGSISADLNTAFENDVVTITAEPEEGYDFEAITVTKNGGGTIDAGDIIYDGNTAAFEMPADNVTVSATFTEHTAVVYALYNGALTEGDYVIYYNGYAMKNTVSSDRLTYTTVTPSSNKITDPDASIIWHIAPSDDYWTIYNESVSQYAAGTGAANKAQLLTDGTDNKSLWTVDGTATYEFVNKQNAALNVNANLRNNGTYGFACYSTSTGGALTLYKKVVNSTLTVGAPENGTITATPAGASAIAEGGSDIVSSSTTITLNATGEGTYVLNAWDVYKTGETTTKVTVTNNTFTMPEYNVTVSASFRQPTTYTAQFSVNGEIVDALTQPNVAENSSITLPLSNNPNIVLPSGYVFAGWTDNPTTCAIISESTYQMTSNMTFYLVFTKSGESLGYKKVEADLGGNWAGDYLIAYSSTVFADGRTGGTSGMGAQNSSVNPGGNLSDKTVALNWGDTYNITLEEISSGSNTYLLVTKDGKYNYYTSNDNGLSSTDNKATASNYPISVTYTSSNNIKLCLGGNATGAVFRYNTSGFFRFYRNCSQEDVYLYKKTQVYTRVSTISDGDEIATINPNDFVTVPNGATLTLTGSNNGTAANLIIEDGGQLICSSPVAMTVEKDIYNDGKEGNKWYTISTPVHTGEYAYVTPENVTNLILMDGDDPEYDMFYYDEYNTTHSAPYWINHSSNLNIGQGYLYRNSNAKLSFKGTNNNEDAYTYYLKCTSAAGPLAGFNLIGNPYPHNIYKNDVYASSGVLPAINDDNLSVGYYKMNDDETWQPYIGYYTPIKPGEGILVKTSSATTLTISNNTNPAASYTPSKYGYDHIEFTVSNNRYEDVSYVMFNDGIGLDKISHRDENAPMIYIPQNGKDYAIATMKDNTETFGLSFKAMTTGKYTISAKALGNFSYIHLIDRLTGEDVDLLMEDYSFIGSPADSDARFIVKLTYMPSYSTEGNDNFAYQTGGEILVSGEGELQIFDVTGRKVMTTTINGVEAISGLSQGVYIFRVIGENQKTQKIVVR